ncbi:GAF domain-containing protein [Streptomyces sp. NPDC093509]|uniref:GAF domain-containing protein n=1 Tax=Streptomyces sp. NPDC093509 TaxID=3154982 RepID=UPI00344B210D
MLSAALNRVLEITQTGMGNVQLAESGRLRMVRHSGLAREFTSYFAFVDQQTTSCAQAAEQRRQVTVRDVATEDVFDEGSRQVILRAGSRGCHSVPLVNRAGVAIGMVSSHHERPLPGFTPAQLRALETNGVMVGRWLSRHRRTVVLDALAHLHTAATAQR